MKMISSYLTKFKADFFPVLDFPLSLCLVSRSRPMLVSYSILAHFYLSALLMFLIRLPCPQFFLFFLSVFCLCNVIPINDPRTLLRAASVCFLFSVFLTAEFDVIVNMIQV